MLAAEQQKQPLSRALKLLVKTVRSQRIYNPNNQTLRQMLQSLHEAFEAVLLQSATIRLQVRGSGFFINSVSIFETPPLQDSVPYALYRDGIRRIEFYQGLTLEELSKFVAAIAHGTQPNFWGDDTVTELWRSQLEHIRYLVMDTTIGNLDNSSDDINANDLSLDIAIDGLLRKIYHARDDQSNQSIEGVSVGLDAHDIPAKAIADQIDQISELAAGFHPEVSNSTQASYINELNLELKDETNISTSKRLVSALLHKLTIDGNHSNNIYKTLLSIYDVALIQADLPLATYSIESISQRPSSQESSQWLSEATSEPRLRQVAKLTETTANLDVKDLLRFFTACGGRSVENYSSNFT